MAAVEAHNRARHVNAARKRMRDEWRAEAKTMKISHVLKSVVILIPVLSAGDLTLYAGSTTYTFGAFGGEGESIWTFQPDGTITMTPIPPPTSITVAINYDPNFNSLGESTSGFTTTYDNPVFPFNITGTGSPNWVGFGAGVADKLVVTAPPPGQGPDSMTVFASFPDGGLSGGSAGDLTILAPNGTLSSSTEKPATLNGFRAGGSFEFVIDLVIDQNPFTKVVGFDVTGTLVPEPSTVVLISVGLCLVLPFAVMRRRSMARSRA
jgi:hypothetical protein